jgi:methionine-R-sulfoxide reductase
MMLKWADVLDLAKAGNPAPDRKVVKTDAEWRSQLSDEEYHVTRQAGTERAFSSEMCSLFEPGIYSCLCCETVLFDASEKFESHTGWPSFTQPIKENVIAYRFDGPAFLKRVETTCNTCDAHLGHVFPRNSEAAKIITQATIDRGGVTHREDGLRLARSAVLVGLRPEQSEGATPYSGA